MQRGENPNQLLSGVVFTQNQAPLEETDFFDFETGAWIFQDFYFPDDYIRGTGDETNIPDFTGVQICCEVREDMRQSAGLDWTVQRYVPALGWHVEAEGVSVQSHAEGDKIWYDVLFDEGIQPDSGSFHHRWRFGLRGRPLGVATETEVPYDTATNIVTVEQHQVNVKLFPDRPHPFILNGVPSILRLKREEQKVYYSVQQGISKLWASRPNPLDTLNVWATDDNEDPLLIEGDEVSLLFRLMGGVGDSGVDFLGNTYREAIRRNHVRNVADVHREEADNYWLSKPNPSRFAVESMYFDMRDDLGKAQVIDQVTIDPITPGVYFHVYFTNDEVYEPVFRTNYIENAHFASSMDLWTGSGVATERVTDRFYISQGSAHLTNAAAGNDYMYYRVTSAENPGIQDQLDDLRGKTVTASGWVYKDPAWALTGGTNTTIAIDDGTTVTTAIGSMVGLPAGTWERQSVTATIPEDADKLEVRAYNGGVGQVWWDGFLLEEGLLGSWFQGEQEQPPPTPVSIHDWEERIWNHVPRTFQAVKRQEHVFPEPVLAKYMKVEFSHLQPRQYSAGDFAQPIAYKKHPRWVLDYFVARREADDYGENGSNFSPRRVGIRYDALDLAYNYYLDDLNQGPDEPVVLDPNAQSQFIEEFRQSATADQADADTLSRIKIVFDQFKEHPTANSASLQAIVGSQQNYPVEYADLPAQIYDTGALRDLHKQQIVWEQTHPVMFFVLPCRHRYKEVLATLKYNRAYFVGVRQIVFSRERYGVENDSKLYVETMGDEVNMERMDFERIAEGQWVTDLGEGTIYG